VSETAASPRFDRWMWLVFVPLIAVMLVLWPLLEVWSRWDNRRFDRLARRASGWNYRTGDDGLRCSREQEPERLVEWDALRSARWYTHREAVNGGGQDQSWAVDVPAVGVAIHGSGERMQPLLDAVTARFGPPKVSDTLRHRVLDDILLLLWLAGATAVYCYVYMQS
jgi:hypothetical protein